MPRPAARLEADVPDLAWVRFASADERVASAWVRLASTVVGSWVARTSPVVTVCPGWTLTAVTLPAPWKSRSVSPSGARFPDSETVCVTVPRVATPVR